MTHDEYTEQIDAIYKRAGAAVSKNQLQPYLLAMLDLCKLTLAHEEFWSYQAHPKFIRSAFEKMRAETEKALGMR